MDNIIDVGMRVWLPCQEKGWIASQVIGRRVVKDKIELQFEMENGKQKKLQTTRLGLQNSSHSTLPQPMNPPKLDTSEDMSKLLHLNEPSVLRAIELRYSRKEIYTYSGIVLIAVNPFAKIESLYTRQKAQLYVGQPRTTQEPHLFAIAEEAFSDMCRDGEKKNQTIVVSGESGAGKTVSANYIMRYFATRRQLQHSPQNIMSGPQRISDIEERIMATNPVLEAFGNAKTIRNDNSSRFGKYIQIMFDEGRNIVGAKTETYLLERSRLVGQSSGERNYHIFYQLVAGADHDQKQKLNLLPVHDFKYLNPSGTTNDDDDDVGSDKKNFEATRLSLIKMGLLEKELVEIFRVLAALLHLGNLKVTSHRTEASVSASDEALDRACNLLHIDRCEFAMWLENKQLTTRAETLICKLTPKQALMARDSVVKYLYAGLFDWLVDKINQTLSTVDTTRCTFIGVLDIYGFEHFNENSLEQFCINYANEKLQQKFNQQVFELEQEEYIREKINWNFIDFSNNQPCIQLIEGSPGILSLLDEECRLPMGSDEKFVNKLHDRFELNGFYKTPLLHRSAFTVRHYAAEVTYESDGFVQKNRDAISDAQLEVLGKSTSKLIRSILEKVAASRHKKSCSSLSKSVDTAVGRRNGDSVKSKRTLGSIFKASLAGLMETMSSTKVHYIRCIKPNQDKKPWEWQGPLVLSQLRASGILDTIRISMAAYPNRQTKEKFARRYYMLCHSSKRTSKDADVCRAILHSALGESNNINNPHPEPCKYQLGLTKIFLRAGVLAFLETERASCLNRCATIIQKTQRRNSCRRRYLKASQLILPAQIIFRGFLARQRFKNVRSKIRLDDADKEKHKKTVSLVYVIDRLREEKRISYEKGARMEIETRERQLAMNLPSIEWKRLSEEIRRLISSLIVSLPISSPLKNWTEFFGPDQISHVTFDMWMDRVFKKSHFPGPLPKKWEVLFPASLINLVLYVMWENGLVDESTQCLEEVLRSIQETVEQQDKCDTVENGAFWLANIHEVLSFIMQFQEKFEKDNPLHQEEDSYDHLRGMLDLFDTLKQGIEDLTSAIHQIWMTREVEDWIVPAIIHSQALYPNYSSRESSGCRANLETLRELFDHIYFAMKAYYLNESCINKSVTTLMKQVDEIALNNLVDQEQISKESKVDQGIQVYFNVDYFTSRSFCCHQVPQAKMHLTMQAVRVLQLSGQDNMMWSTEKVCPNLSPFQIQRLLGQSMSSEMSEQRKNDTSKERGQVDVDVEDEDEGSNIVLLATVETYPLRWLEAIGLKHMAKILSTGYV